MVTRGRGSVIITQKPAVPVTDEVWERAAGIDPHIRALDAIHLATCELIGVTLLRAGLDGTIQTVAEQRGIPLR